MDVALRPNGKPLAGRAEHQDKVVPHGFRYEVVDCHLGCAAITDSQPEVNLGSALSNRAAVRRSLPAVLPVASLVVAERRRRCEWDLYHDFSELLRYQATAIFTFPTWRSLSIPSTATEATDRADRCLSALVDVILSMTKRKFVHHYPNAARTW